MLVSCAVGLRRLCEAYGGLRSLFWAAVPVLRSSFFGHGQQTGAWASGRGTTARNGLIYLVRAPPALPESHMPMIGPEF